MADIGVGCHTNKYCYAEFTMSLAVPTNISNSDSFISKVLGVISVLDNPICQVLGSSIVNISITEMNRSDIIDSISESSLVFVFSGMRGVAEPIAGFVINKELGLAKLVSLIGEGELTELPSSKDIDRLAVIIRGLFTDDTITHVLTPFSSVAIDGILNLVVDSSNPRRVTLGGLDSRPFSARL